MYEKRKEIFFNHFSHLSPQLFVSLSVYNMQATQPVIANGLISISSAAVLAFSAWLVYIARMKEKRNVAANDNKAAITATAGVVESSEQELDNSARFSKVSKEKDIWVYFASLRGLSNHVKVGLPTKHLDVDECIAFVSDPSCGAISTFIGTTRDTFEEKVVVSLEYEAYESMGLKELEKICQDVKKNWTEVKKIAIGHILGPCPVRETSVIIAISSVHRKSGLEAVEYVIDTLKKAVPIWKKEVYETTTTQAEPYTWKHS